MARPRLEYSAGNEHDPGDPFGRAGLTIEPDGSARLDHHHVGLHQAWTGRVDTAVLESLFAALERAGFPEVAEHALPAGSTIRSLVAESDGTRQGLLVEWRAAKDLAGYDQAFQILDSLVEQMSEGTVGAGPSTLGPAIADLRRV